MSIYLKDVWNRLPELLAKCTSIYSSIVKINSTKKAVKKLQCRAAGSGSWVTDIGNEHGKGLVSVLTDTESISSLQQLTNGLIYRYQQA